MMERGPGVMLANAVLHPERLIEAPPEIWNEVLIQANNNALLGRIASSLVASSSIGRVPDKARDHLQRAGIAAESSQTAVRYEMYRVQRALGGADVPLVLLKGAAYLAAGLPTARGRLVGDLDFMVPRTRIAEVEEVLRRAGWTTSKLDPYDDSYYRRYAHEIPPLLHPDRQTPLDVHHAIVPLTSRLRPDTDALFAESIAVTNTGWRILAPADMVLHSAVHLFNDEVGKPMRDLLDLHDLLSHFGEDRRFWDQLVARARLHGFERTLYYALRYTRHFFETRVPEHVANAMKRFAPPLVATAIMDGLFYRYFLPDSPEGVRASVRFARWLLRVRAHWLRMPPLLLAHHLMIKASHRLRDRTASRRAIQRGARALDGEREDQA